MKRKTYKEDNVKTTSFYETKLTGNKYDVNIASKFYPTYTLQTLTITLRSFPGKTS
jgi:hypothetical protein